MEVRFPIVDPCAFSPRPRDARRLARFYADIFPSGSTVVDIGCGQGFFLEEAQRCGLKATGIDRDHQLVEDARRRGLQAHVGDATSLRAIPLPSAIDGVLAAHIVEHLEPIAVSALFAEMAIRVKPQGLFLIVTPNFRDLRVATDWFWNDPTHVRPYTSGSLGQLAGKQWTLVREGLEPILVSRRLIVDIPLRLVRGWHFGRSGRWVLFERAA